MSGRIIQNIVPKFLLCILIGLPFLSTSTVVAQEDLGLYARSAVLMDGGSGRVLYGKEEQAELPMASTTKIMTCIIALEDAELDTVCTVSENAASQPKVKLGMVQGDMFYLKDLLCSLMLESHNDSAVCIAETVGGSVEGFAEKMNAKAQEIGCTQTHYVTPNGLDAQDEGGEHRTTARELAMVMRYCLTQSPKAAEFLETTRTPSCTFTNVAGNRSYGCTNHNALLQIMDGALSGKTGFTAKAGYCYVGALEKDGKLLIVALLACGWPSHKGYKWVDTKKLMNYGLENYEVREIGIPTLKTTQLPVMDGQKESVQIEVKAKADTEPGNESDTGMKTALGAENVESENRTRVLMQPEEMVETHVELMHSLEAPVAKEQQVGTVQCVIDGEVYATYPVVTSELVLERNYLYCLREILEMALI